MAKIVVATSSHLPGWAALRAALWPEDGIAEHATDLAARMDAADGDRVAFLAIDDGDAPVGFVEAALRRDYVNGCDTSPVAFVEGVYVRPAARSGGIGRRLIAAVADWGRTAGCTELASDADLTNAASHLFHRAVGFAETERVVFFRRAIDAA